MELLTSLEKQLNDSNREKRLEALKTIVDMEKSGQIEPPKAGSYVNNHIHTIYSFSPYSPTAALYFARKSGLTTAGIMDHDSVGGCEEFVKAGEIANMPITTGFECRVKMNHTILNGKKINNPDQNSVAYVAVHGIPHPKFAECDLFLAPYREKRNIRNCQMVAKINDIISKYNLSIDFDKDVLPLSQNNDGGSVTERHIICGLTNVIITKFGRGAKAVDFIKNSLGISISEKIQGFLLDINNEHYVYDMIGALKSDFVSQFYIDATDECPDVYKFIRFVNNIGAISAYAYLGDVVNSVTGDKKAQKFEDDYIEELFSVIKQLGFNAVTYTPSRNTLEQLQKIMALCNQYELLQISGEDINTSRQSFICPALEKPEFKHLSTATWVLIGHEIAASKDIGNGMFSKTTVAKYPSIEDRIPIFGAVNK